MPENETPRDEVLVIKGRLDRAGQFTPRRCGSTRHVRAWPSADSQDYRIELLDANGAVLHFEPVLLEPEIGCEPGEAKRWRVTAYITLREDAQSVVLRHGEIVVWRSPLPPAPSLEVSAPRRVSREQPVPLRFAYSEPGAGAFLQVVYQWGERRFRAIYVGPPRELLEFNLAPLPGGQKCRFVVQYSNGLRSAANATSFFALPLRGPELRIVQPAPRTVLTPGQPLVLEGQVLDPERAGGPRPMEDLSWFVDGNLAGHGPVAGVDKPGPGRHRIALRYRNAGGVAEIVTGVIVRDQANTVPADDWPEFDAFPEENGQRPAGA